MEIEITRVSQKGQVVIPSKVRDDLKLKQGDQLLVFGTDGTIVLKKIEKPVIEKSFNEIVKPIREKIKELGLTRESVTEEIKKRRFRK